MSPDDLLKPGEVAKLFNVTDETVRRWAENGGLPFVKLPSGQRRFRRGDVDARLVTITAGADE